MPGGPRPRITSPVAIDREDELAVFESTIDLALGGEPRTLIVAGEAGVGKTRLVEEATDSARARGMRVLRGGCLELGTQIPYLPFVQIMRTLLRELPPAELETVVGSSRDQLALLVPELAARRGSGASDVHPTGGTSDAPRLILPGAGRELSRLLLFDALLGLTERAVAKTPTIVVVEDLQWADGSTLDLLGYLRNGLRRGTVLLVVTVRPEEADGPALAFLANLERGDPAERIDLPGFTSAQTGHQIAAILGQAPDPALVTALWELSAGNPFYTEELLAIARPSRPDADATSPAVAGSMTDAAIPPRLRDVLRARTAPLAPESRAVLRMAAIAGRTVDARLLARASGTDPATLEPAFRSLLDEHLLIAATDDARGGFRFRHEVMRAYIASQVLPSEAARLHASLARALEADPVGGAISGELAHHWDAAGEIARAFPAHVDAATEAEDTFAFEEAYNHLARAMELWDVLPEPASEVGLDRSRLAQRAADAAARAGHLDRAIALARIVIDDGTAADPGLVEYMRSSLRWYLWQAGQIDDAVREAELAVAALSGPTSARWRANALVHLAGLRLMSDDIQGARRAAGRAQRLAASVGASDEEAMARGIAGWCLIGSGRLVEGLDLIRAVWKAAVESRTASLTGIALAYEQLASASEVAGKVQETADVASEGVAWAARHGLARTAGAALLVIHARALYHLGRWDDAERIVARSLDRGAAGASASGMLIVGRLLAVGRGREVEIDQASPLDGASSSTATSRSPGWSAVAAAERALWERDAVRALEGMGFSTRVPPEVAAEVGTGRTEPAGASTRDSVTDASVARRMALAARAVADLVELERSTAKGTSRSSAHLIPLVVQRLSGPRGRTIAGAWGAWVAIARAELGRARREPAPSLARLWRRAAGTAADRDDPYAEAYARWRLAETMLAGRMERAAAATELRAALMLAGRLGAGPLMTELELLARRARVSVGPGDVVVGDQPIETAPFDLTPREQEVLGLLASGDSNREIGAKLYISPKTASVHVSNILGKLGVEGRVEAAILAQRLGLSSTANKE